MGIWRKRQYQAPGLPAEFILTTAKRNASIINASYTVETFEKHFNELLHNLDDLIFLNERQGVPMTTSPWVEKKQILKNMEATINDFIDRAEGHTVTLCGAARANRIELLVEEIETSQVFCQYITAKNRAKLNQLRIKARELRKAEQERIARENAQKEAEKKFDNYLALIQADEKNWIRSQRGVPSIDDELGKVDNMDGHTFEEWCAELLRKNGFTDVSVTPGSRDQGVDILAKKDDIKYAIQCKCYSIDVGNAPVQEVHAGKEFYCCQVGAVMTNQYFTKPAQELALKTGTLLWDRTRLTKMLENL